MSTHLNRMFAALAAMSALAVPPALAARPASASPADVTTQLPRTVRPTHYDVAVTPDAGALSFTGKVVISVEVLQPTAAITLNALDLAFSGARLTGGAGGDALEAPQVAVDAAAQTATFTFAKPIPRGRLSAGARLHGQDRDPGRRAVRPRLRHAGGPEARALHPVRELGRAPDDPLVGRAGLQGDVHPRGDRARRRDGGQQHAGRPSAPTSATAERGCASRPRRGCPPICSSSPWATSSASPRRVGKTEIGIVTRKGAHRPGRLRPRVLGRDPARVQRLLRHALSAAQARQHRRSRPQPVLRRHGELGRHLQLRVHPARRPVDLHASRTASPSSRWPRTRSRTSGSATWSPWPGGTTSG